MVSAGWLACQTAFPAQDPAALSIRFEPDGSARLENGCVALRVSNRPGPDNGILSWRFKPADIEMVDVLYGQTDYVKGHLLGERWDAADLKAARGGTPACGSLYAPVNTGVSSDGSLLELVQTARDGYALTRTLRLRRDWAAVESRYTLKNIAGKPVGASLRFHSAMSPGARGTYQRKDDTLFLPTEAGLTALDQTLGPAPFKEKYGEDKFFNAARSNEPPRAWVTPASVKTPVLTGNWAAWVNAASGDGLVFVMADRTLLGFYNCPGTTLEPVLKAFALQPGEAWETRVVVGSFSGAKGKTICGATPLYVVTVPLDAKTGTLQGELIPLFAGRLRVSDGSGKTVFEVPAAPDAPVAVKAAAAGEAWRITALDRAGAVIGSVDASGAASFSEPVIAARKVDKPAVKGDVYVAPEADALLARFLADRDFAVQCDWASAPAEKEAAAALARELKAGVLWTSPQALKVIAIGNPGQSGTVRDVGLLKDSITAEWPGKGRGAILAYDNFELTKQPVLVVAGSDADGTAAALRELRKRLPKTEARSGFGFQAVGIDLRIFPYTPEGTGGLDRITIHAARGEYESSQLMIKAFEDLKDIEVTLVALTNAATGKPIAKSFSTPFRRRNGPLWLRWVNYYPTKPADGWTGYPDPLLERPETTLACGQAQGVWLTTIVSEQAAAGLYQGAITCSANGKQVTVPIDLTVWDFTLPTNGVLKGEPYTSLVNFPPADSREVKEKNVKDLVENMVEHGMRVFHLQTFDMIRWHFDPEGRLKNAPGMDWLEVSEDGKVALDAGRMDELVRLCDETGKPWSLEYMVYIHTLLDGTDSNYGKFKRAFPDRFKGQPAREGHFYQDYYAQEMITLFRKHLEKKNWLSRFVLKVGDEPAGFDFWWNRFTLAAREAKMPLMTCFNSIDWTEAEKGLGQVALWQPLYMKYDEAFFRKAREAGAKISWYNCGPPPRMSVHTGPSELRSYIWQAAKADLDSLAWWGIQCWGSEGSGTGAELWQNRYSHWNTVVYPRHPEKPAWQKPGKPGWCDSEPLDSVRWEHIRDGMEDAWTVNLLRSRIAEARKKGLADAADKADAVLAAIWKDVFPTLNDYNPAFARVLESRERVAAAILDLQAAGAAAP
jgi:hypothetical protein